MKLKISTVVASMLFAANSANAAVEISSKPTANMSCTGGICTPTAKKAVLNVSDLAAMLANGDTAIKSTNTNPDIEIDAALSWTSTSRLTLDSYRAIAFNKPVVVTGTGAMTITTNDGGSGGDFRFVGKAHISFWTTDSALVINGHQYTLVSQMGVLMSAIGNDVPYIALVKDLNLAKHHYHQAPIAEVDTTVEGLGHTISNLTINDPTQRDLIGLIGIVTFSSVVRDLGLKGVNITGSGIEQLAGALVAENSGRISGAFTTGAVALNGRNSQAGGLVGDNGNGDIFRSYSTVTVSGINGVFGLGGLVADNVGDCTGSNCDGVVDESYALGAVSSDGDAIVGGLIGQNLGGTIKNSYAGSSSQSGDNGIVGGLIGANGGNPVETISDSYSYDLVSGGSSSTLGGLIGQDAAAAQNAALYWNLDTSGINDPSRGAGNIVNDPGITGLSDTQLKSGLPAGFDKKVWKQKGSVNNGYPYLADNPPPN